MIGPEADSVAGAHREIPPGRRGVSAATYVIAGAGTLSACAGLAARFITVTNHATLIAAAMSPYLTVGAAVACAILLLSRHWWTASAAAVLTAAAVAAQLPLFVASNQIPGTAIPVRVLTANVREGTADATALATVLRASADIVAFQELTPELVAGLKQQGLDSDFPHQALAPRPGAVGVGVVSRHPIVGSRRIAGYQQGVVSADIQIPGAAETATLIAAHLSGPWPQPIDGWRRDISRFPDTLSEVAARAGSGAVIVAGDFNATIDMAPFRRLLRDGFHSAAEQAGAGFVRSFPADATIPPAIGIDHVLTLNSAASRVGTVRIPGSDHLAVLATVNLRAG